MNFISHYTRFFWQKILPVLLCLTGLVTSNVYASDFHILVVLSNSSTPYQAFAHTFRKELPESIKTTLIPRVELYSGDDLQADLVVTVGVNATEVVLAKTSLPVLAAMIPSNTYEELVAKRPKSRQNSAIYLDQPWARQAALLHAVLPEHSRIGVLHSPDSRLPVQTLRSALSAQGFTMVDQPLHDQNSLFTDLEQVLTSSNALLAVPDNMIYSSSNIRNILLSSYRRSIPLIGLSYGYVRAGALCAVFSTPDHIGKQASTMSASFAQTRKLPEPQFPAYFTVAVNPEVARTLNTSIKSAEEILSQLEKLQGGTQ